MMVERVINSEERWREYPMRASVTFEERPTRLGIAQKSRNTREEWLRFTLCIEFRAQRLRLTKVVMNYTQH